VRSHAKAASAPSTHRESSRLSFGVIAAMLVCAAAFLGIGAPAASAAPEAGPGWAFKTSFSVNFSNWESTRSPIGTDGQGNVFAMNQNQAYVDLFAPEGTSRIETVPVGENRNLAVDPATDALYVAEMTFFSGGTGAIRRFTSDGSPVPTYTQDPGFEVPGGEGMAVDPTTHDLLVADPGAETVRRYETDGTLADTISATSLAPAYIAVATDGSFYIASASGPDVTHMAGNGTILGTIAGVGTPQGLAWDSGDGALVVSVDNVLETYSASGELLTESPAQTGTGLGLAYDAVNSLLYQYSLETAYVYAPGTRPGVESPVVSDVGAHSAHVSAEVDPGEGPPAESEGHFEYRVVGDSSWKSTPDQSLTTPGVTTLEADITGLLANLDYEVRFAASNAVISLTSAPVPFSTPEVAPEVFTAAATDVTETSAVLNGTINPNGNQTTYHFEYGTTTAYGSRVPVSIEAAAGGGRDSRSFSRTISGLQPGTTYHYRLVATNSLGTADGGDRTFTTDAVGAIPLRGYEQVSPIDKNGDPIEGGAGFQAKADGSAFAYYSRSGDLGSPQYAYAFSRRETSDWNAGIDLSVPLNVTAPLGPTIIGTTTIAISADFTHEFVATNRALTPGAIEGGGNLYLVDLEDRTYTLVATNSEPNSISTFISVQTAEKFQGGAPDLSWFVFKSFYPMLEGAPFEALYRWSESGGLEVVSELPDGELSGVFAASDKTLPVRSVSADGSRIYFTTNGGSESGVFLREGAGPTKAISVSQVPGDPSTPQPARLVGISGDGRYAFFGSLQGKGLTSDTPTGLPGNFAPVYRYDAVDGSLEYTGASVDSDASGGAIGVSDDGNTAYFADNTNTGHVWRNGVEKTFATGLEPSNQTSEISADGRYIVYETGSYGNLIVGDVNLYDAETEETFCASCLSDGSPGDAFLPGGERYVSARIPQAVTNSGQALFTSRKRLVAADANGRGDVYEFQDGRASLISPGNAPFDATFADISEDAHDVFFTTSQKLVGQDNDGELDVYDSRIGGGLALQNPPPPQECLRDDCKATPNAGPELPFGGSEALSGPGNVTTLKHKRCGKGKRAKKVKGNVRCVKKHTKHKASKNKKGGNR
jgi:hypothetical protein